MNEIKTFFRAISNKDLLKKCLHGLTQNVNQSFNNIVWSRVPKSTLVGLKTLELGVRDAVISFNDGNVGRLRVLEELGVTDLGKDTIAALQKFNTTQMKEVDRVAEEKTKEARVKNRWQHLAEEEQNQEDYCLGGF